MIIEYSEADESRVRWEKGGEWKSADIEELIAAYEWKQSIPHHGDLIDRDALVEAVKDYPYGFRGMILCDIAKQPTIEPKVEFDTESWKTTATDTPMVEYAPVKKGKWIKPSREDGLSYDERAFAECSVCGKKEYIGWEKPYCPWCGARMTE